MAQRNDPQVMLRVRRSLHSSIKAAAAANGRSMNSEIEHTLSAVYPDLVEPESINQDLLDASREIAASWSELLAAVGQEPAANSQLSRLQAAIDKAAGQ